MRRLLAAALLALLAFSQAGSAEATTWQGSSIWAGTVDKGPVTRISGDLIVPVVTTECGASSWAAVWLGIGGNSGTDPLAQMGLTLTPSGVGAWWALVGSGNQGQEQDVAFAAATGDHVRLSLWWDTVPTLRMRWSNLTTGKGLLVTLTSVSAYRSSTVANWVVEKVDGHPLARFWRIYWTDAWYGQPTTERDLQPAAYQIEMTDAAGTLALVTYPVDTRSMTAWWKRC